jgi:hypothetical protein
MRGSLTLAERLHVAFLLGRRDSNSLLRQAELTLERAGLDHVFEERSVGGDTVWGRSENRSFHLELQKRFPSVYLTSGCTASGATFDGDTIR